MRIDRWSTAAGTAVAAGVALAVVAHLLLGPRRVFLSADPAAVLVVAAVLVAGALLMLRLLRRRGAARRDLLVAGERDRAREERRRFLLRLDHELKNPLQAIRIGVAPPPSSGNAAAASSGAPTGDDSGGGGRAGAVDLQVIRITRLLTDLRKLAELEVHPLETAAVDLRDLLEEAAAAAADLPGADARNVQTVVPRAPWPVPAVIGDRDLLSVALHNLLANAVKYSGPGDTIELRASEDGDTVLIEVADTGAGIPVDEQDLVWDELARGRGARSLPGSGLGLPLVRVVVARHGGTTTLRSRSGEGTVVAVRLPAARREQAASPGERTAPGVRASGDGTDVAGLRQRRDTPATPPS